MFYNLFADLCVKKGVAPSKAATEIGLAPAHVSKWKKGSKPQYSTVVKVAEYFDVDVDYFNEKEKDPSTMTDAEVDQELHDILTELKDRPELRMLFHSTKGVTKENIEALAKMVEGFQRGDK